MKKLIIAVDGFSACGKSTLAKDLAAKLGYIYVDSGAMYRGVTLFFIRHDIDLECPQAVEEALAKITLEFRIVDGHNHLFLNGEDIEKEIRKMYVSARVSEVSVISAVRKILVAMQQKLGEGKEVTGVVMDGRDIGTVVFPGADLKLFVTADPEVRVRRRYEEGLQKGEKLNLDEVSENLKKRDHIDSTRADSPLRKALDAVVLDNTNLTKKQQLQKAIELAKNVAK